MSEGYDSPSNRDPRSKFTAKETDHIKVRSSNGSSSRSRYSPYNRRSKDEPRSRSPDRSSKSRDRSRRDVTAASRDDTSRRRSEERKRSSDQSKIDGVKCPIAENVPRQENALYVPPIQQYPKFEDPGRSDEHPPQQQSGLAPLLAASVHSKPTKKKMTVASVFNCDSSEDEEEIPLHAKMRMRNVGKDTPTSSGPNSFGKTKRGFTDTVKMWEKDPVKVAQYIVEKQNEATNK